MRNYIVTNKNILMQEMDELTESPIFLRQQWLGVDVIGKRQLCEIVMFEAEQRVKEKYLKQEFEEILKEIVIKKPSKKEAKKIFNFVRFA